MIQSHTRFNGIHPGAILKRELKKRSIKPIELASEVGEHKQTISAILNEKRASRASSNLIQPMMISIQHVYDKNAGN
jgi:plasmid maintenance system antidote protein VapI